MAGRDMGPVTVLVFARAPIAGRAKTRLIPALGPAGAAAFQAALTLRALETARAAGIGPVRLCCAPDAGHPFFADCRDRRAVELRDQHGVDLGERMHRALAATLGETAGAILIGTDIPLIDADYLGRAAAALQSGHEAVFGPVEDGGYGLVGLRRPLPGLFESVPWGTSGVWDATRERLRVLGCDWRALPRLWDIDEAVDLERLAREYPALHAELDKSARMLAASLADRG